MADTREVVIKVVDGRNQGNGSLIDEKVKKEEATQELLPSITSALQNPSSSVINAIKGSIQSPVGAYAFYRVASETVSLTKRAVNFGLSNVGRWTGDITAVHQVEQIQLGLEIAKSVGNVGLGAMSGFVAGGVVGAVVGGGIALVDEAVDLGQQAYNYQVNIATENRSVAFIKQRAGSVLNDWSR